MSPELAQAKADMQRQVAAADQKLAILEANVTLAMARTDGAVEDARAVRVRLTEIERDVAAMAHAQASLRTSVTVFIAIIDRELPQPS